jgi:site-specific DNA recombinase
MRVATYTRISTDEDHQPYSLESQAERLGNYLASQDGWELTRSFTDQASGATTERPGLQRALAEARAGRFDLLLVYRVDRFARSVRGLAQLLEDLDSAGVAFRSATEPFDTTTAAGRMMVQMLGVFAEFERATIVDRVIAGMERKVARGGWCGPRPFGYVHDPASGFLAAKENEAPLVPLMFGRYAHSREGARSVANWLNAAGHRTKAGRLWSHTAVLTILRNPVYVGKVTFRGEYHPAPHVHLVEDKLFDRVQALLSERGEDYSKRASASSDYLLTGLIICERCGKRFVGTSATGNRYRYRYYTCFTRQRYGTTTCNAERLPADDLDTVILDALRRTYERSDLIEKAVHGARARVEKLRTRNDQELVLIDTETAKAEESIERYLGAFEAGTLSEAQCGARMAKLGAKVIDLRRRREDLVAAMEQGSVDVPSDTELSDLRAHIEEALINGAIPAQKAVLQSLIHEVRVESRERVVPWFRVRGGEPAKVRALGGFVGARGLEPPTSAV